MDNTKRITDIISDEDIVTWKPDKPIIITAGTGKGKSYFVKNVLYEFAKKENKKILMLLHRTLCVKQFRDEIIQDNKADIIDIDTYQKFEHKDIHNFYVDLSEYKYIVSDEFHYFISDAGFNITTDISLNIIFKQKNAIKIFMSATSEDIERYIINVCKIDAKKYNLPLDFTFIQSLTFFNKDETIEGIIKEKIEKKEKSIIFVQSVIKAYQLFIKFKKYAIFNCSKNNSYYKYVDENKITDMLNETHFDELILITTSCLDAGVNIIDRDLKNIIIDLTDINSLIQAMGRKRIQDKDDKVNIYVKNINIQQLNWLVNKAKYKLEMADFLSKNNSYEFVNKYRRKNDYSGIIYDDVDDIIGRFDTQTIKKVNQLMYLKYKFDIVKFELIRKIGDFGYCKFMADMFGFYDEGNDWYDYSLFEQDQKNDDLKEYIDTIIGIKLYKEQQKELIEKIDLRVHSKLQKSYSKLNEGLKWMKLPYIILPKKSNDKRYWIIDKIDI